MISFVVASLILATTVDSVHAKTITALDAQAEVGQTGDVRIVIDNPDTVAGIQLKLKFDASKLEYQSYTIGPLFANWYKQVVPSPGVISLAAAFDTPVSQTTEADIITITFKAIGNPGDVVSLLLENVYLSDSDGNLLTVQTHNGEFTILSGSIAPTVVSATPDALGQGASGKNVVIAGTNFQSGASVTFSNPKIIVNSISVVNATQITVNVSVATDAPTGSCDITVTNPDAQSGTGTDIFTVNPAPTITRLEPDNGQQGATLNVTIIGADFRDGAPLSVFFSATGITINSITFINATEIHINIRISADAPPGSRDVTVTNGDSGVGSKTDAFSVTALGPSAIIRPVADSPQLAGTEFTVDITVENVENLFGVAFVLNYDTTYINAVSAVKGDFLGDNVLWLDPVIDDNEGTVSIGITRKRPADGVDGSGIVARVTFISTPETPDGTSVNFTITDIDAVDPDATPILLSPESMTVIIRRLCVWPGDTNNDGEVDQADVLPLGIHWEREGPPRPDASLIWECQMVTPWNPEAATYADANGSGIVDQADVLPIGVNWGLTHDGVGSSSSVFLQQHPVDGVQPSVIKPIVIRNPYKNQFTVGIKVERVNNLFGIAFALKYPRPNAIKPLSVEAGDYLGSDVVSYHNVDDSKGMIRIGISRKRPQGGVNGSGIIAKITFQSDLKLAAVRMTIQEITAIDADGRIILFGNAQNEPNNGEWLMPLPQAPGASDLSQNFPNPFNPETWIPFQLKEAADVTISIYDASGKMIRVMNLGEKPAGFYNSKETAAYWDGRNSNGEVVASGVYFYSIRAGKFFATKKMIVVR